MFQASNKEAVNVRITDPLWEEFVGDQCISLTKGTQMRKTRLDECVGDENIIESDN